MAPNITQIFGLHFQQE